MSVGEIESDDVLIRRWKARKMKKKQELAKGEGAKEDVNVFEYLQG